MKDFRIAALCEAREARELFALLPKEAVAERPRPAAVSGLPVSVLTLLIREGCRILAAEGHPILVMVGDEPTAARLVADLTADGLRAAAYLPREYILYHITASHETERSRLRVLSGLLHGTLDVVVTTPVAALGYTVDNCKIFLSHFSVGYQGRKQRCAFFIPCKYHKTANGSVESVNEP